MSEPKTQVRAEANTNDILISRIFDLPVELVFKAYTEAEFLEQWMGTKVVHLESKKHGSYQFETLDASGNPVFRAHGSIHNLEAPHKMVRTFEMEQLNFGVQLEFLSFEALSNNQSRLQIRSLFETVSLRDAQLKLPFAWGINRAHDCLEKLFQTNPS